MAPRNPSHCKVPSRCSNLNLAAQLALYADDVLGMRVLPQRRRHRRLDRGQGLARAAAVAVELLEQRLRARDRGLGDGEVRACHDALQPLGLGEKRRVLERRF